MICPRCGRDLVEGRCVRCDTRRARRSPIARTATFPSGPVKTAPAPTPTPADALARQTTEQSVERELGTADTTDGLALASTAPAGGDSLIGVVINERFRVTSFLGEGAMGGVYRAEQLGLARDVAVKFIHRHLLEDPSRLARFEREAVVLSKLEHPNIVAIHDFGSWSDQTYIAMQYLDGQSLEAMIQAGDAPPLEEIVRVVGAICDALDAAHQQGIVHRDLKPENVMLVGAERQVKLVDFGVAKLVDSATKLTQEGTMVGTPSYMAPEQCAGEQVGPQTDIYALGVILYELLTRKLPFRAETLQGLIFKHMLDDPAPPSEVVDALHPALDEVTLWALNKKREARPQTASAFKARLLDALEQASGRASDGHRRKDARYAGTRADRSKAITAVPLAEAREKPAEGAVIVVGSAADSADSPATRLSLAGYQVRRVDGAAGVEAGAEKVVVVDFGDDAAAGLAALEPLLDDGRLAGLPVVVVGPDGAMDQMSRALELKLAAYVPRSKLQKRLAKAVRRAARRSAG